jgi:hypothetical protein
MPSTCRSLRLSGGVWGCLGAGLCSSHGSPQTPAAPPLDYLLLLLLLLLMLLLRLTNV